MRRVALEDMKEAIGLVCQAMRDLSVAPHRRARLAIEGALHAATERLRHAEGAAVASLALEPSPTV